MTTWPRVPIVDASMEASRDLLLSITRSSADGVLLLTIKQFCPKRKCTTAGECAAFDEAVLDERMADE